MGERTAEGLYDAKEMDDVEDDDDDENDEDEDGPASRTRSKGNTSTSSKGVFSFFQSLTGQKTLSADDLAPVLAKMKEHLISKNVAAEIADTLANSVSASLVGQKQSTFSSLSNTVKASMELALKRILTPRSSTDILRDILAAKASGRPYTFVFVGVNGVGKSTNLSKVCFWLLQNKLKVLIAACDTFRSGAVEQLRVHARNLKALESASVVELYERGYGKDAANIAKDAINYGEWQLFVALYAVAVVVWSN
jgi:signal recognition particle receptor subunit alpha